MPQVRISPVGEARWDLPAFHNHETSLHGILLGAGLSKAANPDSPTWSELVKNLADHFGIDVSAYTDPNTAAFHLHRAHRDLRPTALATPIQQEIKRILEDSKAKRKGIDQALSAALKLVIERTRCDVIIDLNYDDVAEEILRQEKLNHYLVVGSEVDVVAPLPFERHLILWKIHGSIKKPSTIVLSPTDYERIYHTNALQTHLRQLGNKLTRLLTVGVGLTDDDIWQALCAEHLEIIALWQSDKWREGEAKNVLSAWLRIVGATARCTVLSAPLPADGDPENLLARRLNDFADRLDRVPSPNTALAIKKSAKKRWEGFDIAYRNAVRQDSASRTDDAVSNVTREYARDYDNLLHTLATWTTAGPGPRYLASLRLDGLRARTNPDPSGRLAGDLAAILDKTRELYESETSPESNIIVACCAQEVVRLVLDIVHILELGSIAFDEGQIRNPEVRRGDWILVGLNPFARPSRRYNPLHYINVEQELPIRPPLWTVPDDNGKLRQAQTDGEGLQKEDEWEARLVRLYKLRKPILQLGSQRIDLAWAPPIFPWGFHMGGLADYRRSTPGTVSKAWHLVHEIHDLGEQGTHQVCKGGSLRDTNIEFFKLAYRGYQRLGESDDFVQPAPA